MWEIFSGLINFLNEFVVIKKLLGQKLWGFSSGTVVYIVLFVDV